MMNSIKRYDIKIHTHRKKCSRDSGLHFELIEHPIGDICRARDIEQLLDENNFLKERLALIASCESKYTGDVVDIAQRAIKKLNTQGDDDG